MIIIYYQTKTIIDFLCKRELNSRYFIQWPKTLPIEVIITHETLIYGNYLSSSKMSLSLPR